MYSNPVLWQRTILKQKHPTQSFEQDQYMHSTKKIFIILDPFNFLKRIERWPDNKVMDISDLTTEQQRIHKHEKEEKQP
jgi:hypothetical protein